MKKDRMDECIESIGKVRESMEKHMKYIETMLERMDMNLGNAGVLLDRINSIDRVSDQCGESLENISHFLRLIESIAGIFETWMDTVITHMELIEGYLKDIKANS